LWEDSVRRKWKPYEMEEGIPPRWCEGYFLKNGTKSELYLSPRIFLHMMLKGFDLFTGMMLFYKMTTSQTIANFFLNRNHLFHAALKPELQFLFLFIPEGDTSITELRVETNSIGYIFGLLFAKSL
jgi:hypothetical protein